MPMDQFRKYMSPDFQAPTGPMMDWAPMEGESGQVGQDAGSILKLLKPPSAQQQPQGFGTKNIIGGGPRNSAGGGMNSL